MPHGALEPIEPARNTRNNTLHLLGLELTRHDSSICNVLLGTANATHGILFQQLTHLYIRGHTVTIPTHCTPLHALAHDVKFAAGGVIHLPDVTSSCWREKKSRASRRGRPPVPEDTLAFTSCPCPSGGPDHLSLGTPGCVALTSCPRERGTDVALTCCPWRQGIGVILTSRLLGLKLQLGENQKAAADTCWSARLGRPGQSFAHCVADERTQATAGRGFLSRVQQRLPCVQPQCFCVYKTLSSAGRHQLQRMDFHRQTQPCPIGAMAALVFQSCLGAIPLDDS
ncbi:hypothetical protein O3P69_018951 [Scylla paramamosain]|uniref:Uncharacterized protein n=1 Tax=Scylla paramamosain TaxID=85552 RepID=A0AAW0SEN4_SCYPA